MDCPDIKLTVYAQEGDLEGVKKCLALGVDPEVYNNEAFRRACKFGHLNVVKHLTQIDKPVMVKRDKNLGFEYATIHARSDVIEYLLFDEQLIQQKNNIELSTIMICDWRSKNYFGRILEQPQTLDMLLSHGLPQSQVIDCINAFFRTLHLDSLDVILKHEVIKNLDQLKSMPECNEDFIHFFEPLWNIQQEKNQLMQAIDAHTQDTSKKKGFKL